MRVIYWMAGVEAVLVAAWIGSFASAVGTQHQHWYVEIPLVFLVLPAASVIISAWIGKIRKNLRSGIVTVLGLLLFCNFLAFGFYGALSGGGV
jgi:NADH:ubiquinone oxidoreductase subunit 3 (subunit A)